MPARGHAESRVTRRCFSIPVLYCQIVMDTADIDANMYTTRMIKSKLPKISENGYLAVLKTKVPHASNVPKKTTTMPAMMLFREIFRSSMMFTCCRSFLNATRSSTSWFRRASVIHDFRATSSIPTIPSRAMPATIDNTRS